MKGDYKQAERRLSRFCQDTTSVDSSALETDQSNKKCESNKINILSIEEVNLKLHKVPEMNESFNGIRILENQEFVSSSSDYVESPAKKRKKYLKKSKLKKKERRKS